MDWEASEAAAAAYGIDTAAHYRRRQSSSERAQEEVRALVPDVDPREEADPPARGSHLRRGFPSGA